MRATYMVLYTGVDCDLGEPAQEIKAASAKQAVMKYRRDYNFEDVEGLPMEGEIFKVWEVKGEVKTLSWRRPGKYELVEIP
jgi:hypothetical protein